VVNIKDIDQMEKEEDHGLHDKLEIIWWRQSQLRSRYAEIEIKNGFHVPVDVADLDNAKDQHFLKDFAWRITEELGEAMNCLKNKPWKQTHMETDKEHFVEEVIDGFHFYIEMMQWIGITPDDLVDLYLKKSRVNKFRQRSGY
jgi:dimeric dUTPase (all-alpha-NTP-PPase superfamily)